MEGNGIGLSYKVSLAMYLLLKHWWVDCKRDPPYDIFGSEFEFWEFAAGVGQITNRYARCHFSWIEITTEFTRRLTTIIDNESRRPNGQEMNKLAKLVVGEFPNDD